MTDNNDYYEILGVSRGADDKEIKSAYKQAARKYHPDNKETGSEEKFKTLGEAYETLKDPQKRTIYDKYGKEALKGAGGSAGFGDFSGAAGFEDLGDIFSSFFGGGFSSSRQRGPRQTRGQDHSVEINLKFLDPLNETKKKIRINPLGVCKTCNGLGAASQADISTCGTCNGQGQVTMVQNTILGQIRQSATCPDCNGRGKAIKNPCSPCKGKGYKREEKEIEVTIPAGIADGNTMRVAGVGDVGSNGGPPGDIYLHISTEENQKFRREGQHVYSEVEISFADAALGINIKVPTITGDKDLKINPGLQSNTVQTLKNEGFPELNRPSRKGDHYIKIIVKTPTSLSSEEKKLLQELQKLRHSKDLKI
ncbi:MAG: molecular chaperone DnaJ [Candidatus Caenarcaniphilales bacterium]|nr:molecular chaperone DnaJ [Candidatus Caenarcaniphilales bacterium]